MFVLVGDNYLLSSVFMSLTLFGMSSFLISVDETFLQVFVGILGSFLGFGAILSSTMVVIVSMIVFMSMIMVVTMSVAVLVADSVVENLDLDEVEA
jgi:hypothetical protein